MHWWIPKSLHHWGCTAEYWQRTFVMNCSWTLMITGLVWKHWWYKSFCSCVRMSPCNVQQYLCMFVLFMILSLNLMLHSQWLVFISKFWQRYRAWKCTSAVVCHVFDDWSDIFLGWVLLYWSFVPILYNYTEREEEVFVKNILHEILWHGERGDLSRCIKGKFIYYFSKPRKSSNETSL